nr:hypothetical protein [uncultured Carboxylicivirga sp.]
MSNIIKIISTLTFLICVKQSYCQDKMVIDNYGVGSLVYGTETKPIYSLTELPSDLQINLKPYLKKILGNLSDSVSFGHGQLNDSITNTSNRSIPKYDLFYKLSYHSMGIKSYSLHIRIDEAGEITLTNWPTKGYNGKENLKPTEEIQQAALNFAAQKEYVTDNYKVDFMYNSKNDKLCWIFMFEDVRYRDPDIKSYFIIHIDWKTAQIIGEYKGKTYPGIS